VPNISSVIDYFSTVFENTIPMTLGESIEAGATTAQVDGLGNYSNGQTVVFTVDAATPSLKQVFTGQISGSNVVNVVWTYGTNQPHADGAVVIDYVSATTIDMINAGILKFASQTGTLLPAAVQAAITAGGALTVPGVLTPDGGFSVGSINKVFEQRTTEATSGSTIGLVPYNGFSGSYTFPVVAGRTYDIHLHDPSVTPTASGFVNASVYLYINGTLIGQITTLWQNTNGSQMIQGTIPWQATSTETATLTLEFATTSSSYGPWSFSAAVLGSSPGPAILTVNEFA
jgi:hypothetical protein